MTKPIELIRENNDKRIGEYFRLLPMKDDYLDLITKENKAY